VASRGHSLELTNGGCQCWGSITGGYRTPTRKGTELKPEKENGTESKANNCRNLLPPVGACAGLFIEEEVKGLITMP
jgi:hypothetical protein